MPRKTSLDKEKDRVFSAFDYIVKKFSLDLNLIVTSSQVKKDSTLFTIERSARESSDRNTFLITFNREKTKLMELPELYRHAFHEILHSLTWGYIDEHGEVLKYIKDKTLSKELQLREADTRENITYLLERKLGPFALPEAAWDIDD